MANDPARRISAWLSAPTGQRLLQEESVPVARLARRFHGDALLWAGCHELADETVRGCMVRNRFFAATRAFPAVPEGLAALSCELSELPLRNNSLDAMVLHHALETSDDPRGALREVARVLHPGGRLLICAFNPVSPAGLRRAYAGFVEDAFSGGHWVRPGRLLDWLAVLGFERQGRVEYLSYGFPLNRSRSARAEGRMSGLLRRYQPPFGSVYVLSAVKQAVSVRPHWQPARLNPRKLAPVAYPKTAVSRSLEGRVVPFPSWKSVDRTR